MAETDEINLLDIAVFAAENWLLVVLAPLIIAIAAYFISASQPPNYEAQVTIEPPSTVPAHMVTPIYTEALRIHSADGITVAIDKEVITISAAGASPDVATSLVTGHLRRLTAAVEAAIARQTEFADTQASLLDRLDAAIGTTPPRELSADTIATEIAMVDEQARLRSEIDAAEGWLAQYEASTVSSGRGGRSPIVVAALSGLASFIALSVLAAMRRALRRAVASPEDREKLERIKSAILLRSRGESAY